MKFKIVAVVLSIIALVFFVVSLVHYDKYDERWIIGKTHDQIIERYGEFDSYLTITSPNGKFLYDQGNYILKPQKVGFLGTEPPTYFEIKFNQEGIAYECSEEIAKGA